MKKIYSEKEIREIARSLIGKTFGELNDFEISDDDYGKGSFGYILEEDVYQYGANSKSEPDFEEAGIELKVTPYKRNNNGTLSAKERLVLNIINYMNEYKNTFYTSDFWNKNKRLQIVWYLYEPDKLRSNFKVTHELLFEFPEKDLRIIKNDWQIIIDKIKAGKAHEISEADTMYLGACTKGASSKSVRKQPFSDIMAKQRAFSLKTTYMTQLVRKYIANEDFEELDYSFDTEFSFENDIKQRLRKYKGLSVNELSKLFGIVNEPKNLLDIIISRLFGIKGKVSNTNEFSKANIITKTIRINKNNRMIESMSFPAFKFTEIVNHEWEESDLYAYFSTTKFMFAVFKQKDDDEYYFEKVVFWNMPLSILDTELRGVWKKTVDIIKSGNIVKEIKNGIVYNNFPKLSDNHYCHVRPHGRNKDDVYPLPVPDKLTGVVEFTKQCFWLKNKYIQDIINSED